MGDRGLSPEEREALETLAEHGKTRLAEDAQRLLAEIDGGGSA